MSNLEIIQNRSFIHEWILPSLNIIKNASQIENSLEMKPLNLTVNISHENTFMNIYKNGNIIYTLKIRSGLSDSHNFEKKETKLIAAISDVSGFELGEYDYILKIYNNENILLFEDSGIIEVKQNITGETLNIVTPFDLFVPFNILDNN